MSPATAVPKTQRDLVRASLLACPDRPIVWSDPKGVR